MKEYFYFDNAATTLPKPEPVYQFMDQFLRSHGVNPGRSSHELSLEAETMIVQTRRMLSQFFGYNGNPSRVTFSLNATDSMNTALLGLIRPGDHMIITRFDLNAVLRPANHFERDSNVTVTRIPADNNGYVDPEDIRKNISSYTRAVVVNHASNVIGSIQDIQAIGEIVRDSEAVFIVDTCQTAGVIPIRMDELLIDILVYTGHTGLFGPSGIGGMIVAKDIDIRQVRTGGTGVNSVSRFHPEEYPHRLEPGTMSMPGIAGLHAAQEWFAELGKSKSKTAPHNHYEACQIAVQHIHDVEIQFTRQLINAFRALPEVIIYGPREDQPRISTFSINIGDLPAEQVGLMLDADHGICVRPGLHCAPIVHEDQGTLERNGTVRFAPGFFTDQEDIAQAIKGVCSVAEYYAFRNKA